MPLPVHLQLARQIVDTLKSICEHDINYIDTHGKICASTDSTRENEYHEGGLRAARTGEVVTVEKDDPELGVRRGINMPIRYHGDIVAVIGITGEPEEVRQYAFLAQRITRLLLREHEIELQDRSNRSQTGYLIRCLIQNEAVNPVFMKEVLKSNGIENRQGSWRTVVLQVANSEDASNLPGLETDLFHRFDRIGHSLFAYFYPDEFVLIVRDEMLRKQENLLHSLAEKYQGKLRIALGSAGKLTEQHTSYHFAKLGIAAMPQEINLVSFEDLDLEILLAETSRGAAEAYLQKTMSALEAEDKSLLEAYFLRDLSLKETAEALYLHKNTLQYRLNRIRERSGYDPRAFRDAMVLYAGLKLEKTIGLK